MLGLTIEVDWLGVTSAVAAIGVIVNAIIGYLQSRTTKKVVDTVTAVAETTAATHEEVKTPNGGESIGTIIERNDLTGPQDVVSPPTIPQATPERPTPPTAPWPPQH